MRELTAEEIEQVSGGKDVIWTVAPPEPPPVEGPDAKDVVWL